MPEGLVGGLGGELFDFGVQALLLDAHLMAEASASQLSPAAPSKARQIAENLGQVLASAAPETPEVDTTGQSPCTIKVIGVGGGGGNTLNRMVRVSPETEERQTIQYIACNTDIQALTSSLADETIQLGVNEARGLGAGGNPGVGQQSAVVAADEIALVVQDADMVFVTAGMGGGTGSGAAPVVAAIARQADCLTIGIFSFFFVVSPSALPETLVYFQVCFSACFFVCSAVAPLTHTYPSLQSTYPRLSCQVRSGLMRHFSRQSHLPQNPSSGMETPNRHSAPAYRA
jgi:hypothetical protein